MFGAILGDMIGAPYEFDRGDKTKDFPLFTDESQFTDDSVMTIAVAEALLDTEDEKLLPAKLVKSMQAWGRKYPDAGYGARFIDWLWQQDPQPYGSCGNGSAMRVSAAGWLYQSLEKTRRIAAMTALVTHNHPEGVKGAEATAAAIYLARTGCTKQEIKDYIEQEFHYDLSRTCDEIRPYYYHVEICQQTVPEAITAFLEGESFEDVIRTAVSLGGDCDTLTCIAGGIAEAFYGVPDDLKEECRKRLDEDLLEVLDRFEERISQGKPFRPEDNEGLKEAIDRLYQKQRYEDVVALLDVLQARMLDGGKLLTAVYTSDKGTLLEPLEFEGKEWVGAYTDMEEVEKGEETETIVVGIGPLIMGICTEGMAGMILNPFGKSAVLETQLLMNVVKSEPDRLFQNTLQAYRKNKGDEDLIRLLRLLKAVPLWVPFYGKDDDREPEEYRAEDLPGMKPVLLYADEEAYIPIFTSREEMNGYKGEFAKRKTALADIDLLVTASEEEIKGFVINAFSDSLTFDTKLISVLLKEEKK